MSTKMATRLARKQAGVARNNAHQTTTDEPKFTNNKRNQMIWAGVAAALLGLLAIAILVNTRSNDSAAPLELSLGDGSAAGSCLPFDLDTLAAMSPAFSGTVTEVSNEAITLDVDRWYTDGDAKVVKLTTIDNAQALVGGFPFDVGSQYLITASGGAMNYCGYSGPVEPELQSAFNTAFAG